MTRPLVLVVIDGWGCNDDAYGNAIAQARTPVMDRLFAEWPVARLAASGTAVGLPVGQQGNSEVGHLTIGSGRVIYQDLPRITREITTGAFFENSELVGAIDRVRGGVGTLHCLGLVSPGGVHSHQDHALALAEMAGRRGLDRVVFHAFTDGRDEPPTSAAGFVEEFVAGLGRIGVGTVGSVSGRYYAMDRDRRWERLAPAYEALTGGDAASATDPVAFIREAYARGITDEFLEPTVIVPPGGTRAVIRDGDTVVFFNFRPDRARELSHALVDATFDHFPRRRITGLELVTFTEYEAGLTAHVAFPKEQVRDTLAEVVSAHGLRQFHLAETEKYAHVTYFMNGGREEPFPGEERQLIPSLKAPTYDTVPEMSAPAITEAVIERLRTGVDAMLALNLANPDMVGHTGEFAPTVAAVECVDLCIGRISDAVLAVGGVLVVTADHGNAEYKVDRADGSKLTAHTTSPVPLLVVGDGHGPLQDGGGLSDVAPTVLGILGLPQPPAMTGRDLRTPGDA